MMNWEPLFFRINSSKYFKLINLCDEGLEKHLYRYDPVKIIFVDGDEELVVYDDDFMMPAIEVFHGLLKKAIDGKLQLHRSITEDIGYLWNEYLQEKPNHNFVKKELEGVGHWVGGSYLLWSAKGVEAWLYNKNDSIYLEITPVYKWHFSDPRKGDNYISYEEFINNYKPHQILKIDKEVAQQWFGETEMLIKVIESYDDKFLRPHD